MTLSRWRRIVTGVAAGVIVLCAALVGASFGGDNNGVSVAAENRPATTVIPIEEDVVPAADAIDEDTPATSEVASGLDPAVTGDAGDTGDTGDTGETAESTDPVQVIEPEDLPDDAAPDDAAADDGSTGDTAADDSSTDGAADGSDATSGDTGSTDAQAQTPAPAPTAPPPLTAGNDALGTGGGVDDAECALDRLVIYAGARVGGVAGSIRSALAQAGFGAGCARPVTVLASNCPLQFAGVLGAGSGYDPAKSYVASSANVDRGTLTAVMGTVGYTGNEIDILDFGFVNPDRPGEQWIAIFIPPSFSGWENLASRAGLGTSGSSLCAASGEYRG